MIAHRKNKITCPQERIVVVKLVKSSVSLKKILGEHDVKKRDASQNSIHINESQA